MNIKLNASMITLALVLLSVILLLVCIAALHAAHSVPWHVLSSSPNIIDHYH